MNAPTREARSPASTPPQERSVLAEHRVGKIVKQTTPPKYADSLAPGYRRGRPLRLRARGLHAWATGPAPALSGTRRASLLGRLLKKSICSQQVVVLFFT